FDLGEDVVEVIEALDARGDGVGVVADDAGGDDGHAFVVHLARVELDGLGNDEGGGARAFVGIEAQVPRAAGDDQADVAVGQVVGLDRLLHGGGQLFSGVRDGQPDGFGGIP